MSAVLVLHDLGEPDAGGSWRAAAPPGWEVLDQPGHGVVPAPASGAYDPMAVATLARRHLGPDGAGTATVVGVGESAHAAVILAAAGGCARTVLVDGLWGPWPSAASWKADTVARVRDLLADEAALSPPPPGEVDPRTAHGYGITMTPRLARPLWGAITGPTLLVETTGSPTPAGEVAERASWFAGPTSVVDGVAPTAAAVVAVVEAWLAG